jgi:4-amino-4-deoxy-L-arabinose transferase-like glycosyltransferase
VSVPPIGFGLGIVIAVRFSNLRSKHGVWIIVVSILASIIWALIIGTGALDTPTTDY